MNISLLIILLSAIGASLNIIIMLGSFLKLGKSTTSSPEIPENGYIIILRDKEGKEIIEENVDNSKAQKVRHIIANS